MRLPRLASLMAVAITTAGCSGGLPDVFRPVAVSVGSCTVSLNADGESLTPPYRAPLIARDEGVPYADVNFEGQGWSGEVAMTSTLPSGHTQEALLDASDINQGSIVSSLSEAGIYRFRFVDDDGCHQEFDVELEE